MGVTFTFVKYSPLNASYSIGPGFLHQIEQRLSYFAGGFLPPVATKLTQSPWFLKTP